MISTTFDTDHNLLISINSILHQLFCRCRMKLSSRYLIFVVQFNHASPKPISASLDADSNSLSKTFNGNSLLHTTIPLYPHVTCSSGTCILNITDGTMRSHDNLFERSGNEQIDEVKPLSFCLLNARSLRNKSAYLVDYENDETFDIVALTETWLTNDDVAVHALSSPLGL